MATVEGVFAGKRVGYSTAATVDVSGVESGDVLILIEGTNGTVNPTSFTPGISGLGASWSLIDATDPTPLGQTTTVRAWVGTNPTGTSGRVRTVGQPSVSINGRAITVYVLRGLTGGTVTGSVAALETNGTATSPALSAGAGTVVIGAGYADTESNALSATDPATGWTLQAGNPLSSDVRWYRTAHRIPATTANHSVSATRNGISTAILVVVSPDTPPAIVEATGLLPSVEVVGITAETGTVEATGLLPSVEVAGSVIADGSVEPTGLLPTAEIVGEVTVTGYIETNGLLPAVVIEGTFTVGAVLGQVDVAGLLPSADFDVDVVAGGEIGIDVLLPTVEFNGDVIALGLVAGVGFLPTIEALGEVSATGTLEALGILPTVGLAASITVFGEVAASGLLPSLSVATNVLVPVYYEVGAEGLLPALLFGGTTYISNPVAESLYVPGLLATDYSVPQKYAEAMTLTGLVAVTESYPSKIAVRNR